MNCLLVLSLLAAFYQASPLIGASGLRSVCYHTNWSQYRPSPGKFVPEDIDPSLCTHINYAFAKLNGNHLKAFEWNDESEPWSKGMFERFNALKQKQPGLKTLISVGGWNMGSAPFTKMVATAASRQDFATDSVKFLRGHNFDGLDIDWEYPAGRGSPPGDKAKFTQLIQELRHVYDEEARTSGKPALLLTAAVPAGKPNIDAGYDIPEVSKHLDFLNLMTYDLHGSWETVAGHNSPLFARADETGDNRHLNLDWAANYWVKKGAPASKLNIGLGLYGRSFTLSGSDTNVGAQTSGPGKAGQFTREKGFIAYYEICKMEKEGAVVHQIPEQKVPYIVKGNQWVGYDDVQSLTVKVDYIKQHNFGGVMVWALDLDDFRNTCGQGPYPLMHAINHVLNGGSGPIITQPPYTTHRPIHTDIPVTDHAHTTVTQSHNQNHHLNPAISFSCIGKSNGFYVSDTSCSEYYVCAASTAFKVSCARGLYYNPATEVCDFAKNVNCHIAGATTAAPIHIVTDPHHTTTHSTGTVSGEHFCDGKSDGLYKDPSDCHMFYQCAANTAFHEPCAPGTAFSDSLRICDLPTHIQNCI